MLFALIAYLKPGADPIPPAVQAETIDFLGQPLIDIRFAGPLRDAAGKKAGMMVIFEHDSREAAEAFAQESPYRRAQLYDEVQLYEYANEVG